MPKGATVKSIEVKMFNADEDGELKVRRQDLIKLKSKVNVSENMIDCWKKGLSSLQTLSNNLKEDASNVRSGLEE